ncbi:hypothetical protein QVD99_005527 [Batrachochytrium dendrobatidis]|uniref:Centrosomal protein 43 n=1 Tax=Batrachochytrium dendrobatidis (strain JEL423) TaxID=403673 RepID=A0A177WAI5_BATDL|nr:hypothetical protein QVD99_005527 [Batrachochytrium dendrobatidis]OAJ36732.1 hypothetical protein BDEG_20875 [Batrachochytrium dendrobatidis JEL423]
MSAYDDLKDALKQNLRARGVTAKLEAAMRAELFKALDEEEFSPIAVPKETAVMNELVREYLQYNGYGHSLSVFTTESRLSKDIPTREHISQELSIHPRLYPENM